jgi:hypothetical protein
MQLCKISAALVLQRKLIQPAHLGIEAVLMIQESYAIAAKTYPRFRAQFIENVAHVNTDRWLFAEVLLQQQLLAAIVFFTDAAPPCVTVRCFRQLTPDVHPNAKKHGLKDGLL